MTTTTGGFAELLYPGLKKVFDSWGKDFPTEFDKFLKKESTKKAYEKYHSMSGLSAVVAKDEGSEITFVDPNDGYDNTITPSEFALGFRVTRPMYINDQYGKMKKASAWLKRSYLVGREQNCIGLLDNAFATALHDGKVLCATDHPCLNGDTVANRPTNHTDLTPTALKAALINFQKLKDDNGFPVYMSPSRLIIAPDNLHLAQEILKSTLKPQTADNDVNVLKGEVEIFVSHYLSDTDSWFVLDGNNHEFVYLHREGPTFAGENDFDTKDAKFSVWAMWGYDANDWRGIYGSAGV